MMIITLAIVMAFFSTSSLRFSALFAKTTGLVFLGQIRIVERPHYVVSLLGDVYDICNENYPGIHCFFNANDSLFDRKFMLEVLSFNRFGFQAYHRPVFQRFFEEKPPWPQS